MKKIFTLFFALVATSALWAYDFQVDGIYYNILTDKTNEVEVTYGSSKYTGSVAIPTTVAHNGTTYSVTSIGRQAFYSCSSLTSITIPNSVTTIGGGAFNGCSGLTSMLIPKNVESIGEWAFYSCKGLVSITIPNSVKSAEKGAFAYCSGLTSIAISNSLTNIGEMMFQCCTSLASITIPNSVKSIGNNAFEKCVSLTSVVIPNSVTTIGKQAFYNCVGLNSISIGNSVNSIGGGAFNGCSGLTSVTIPNSIETIGDYAFYSCSLLKEVICYAEEIPATGVGVFASTPQSQATLYVPDTALEAYKTAEQWKDFGTILSIQEIENGVENTYSPSANTQKIFRDGHLLIIRDGKTYNVRGDEAMRR